MKQIFAIFFSVVLAYGSFAQQSDECISCPAQSLKPGFHQDFGYEKAMLFDNGGFVTNSLNTSDPDSSVLQGTNSTLGTGMNMGAGYAPADDFTISSGSWQIDSIAFFNYQTGSTTTSSMTAIYVRIWEGSPMSGGTVVWGDTTTNLLQSSTWTNVYRGSLSTWTTTRPIMRTVAATSGLSLDPNTYWVEVQGSGSIASGPWGVPITISGVEASGDALQRQLTTWVALTDGGSTQPLGLPFVIYGSVIGSIEDQFSNSVRIFPVPATDQITIDAEAEISKVVIYDQNGTIVRIIETSGKQTSVGVNELLPGVYHILTETTNGIISTQIVVE